MKTFIQKGRSFQITAPSAVTGGTGFLFGAANLFVIAGQTAASGAIVEVFAEGVYEHAKAAVSITAGDTAYWDNAAKLITNVSTSNTKIGVFVQAQVSGDATGRVRLNGTV